MQYMFFLDYSAYFNTLSCSILYDKLEIYGTRGLSLDFIKAYYENRSQCVCYDAVKSSISSQELGVIQGSKLALFSINILVISVECVVMMRVYNMQMTQCWYM